MYSRGLPSPRVPLLILAGGLPGIFPVHAVTSQFWNPGGTGGNGNWGTGPADTNWNTVPGAAGNTTWPGTPDDVATFQDATGGTVTVFGNIPVAGIAQDGSDYHLVGGSLNLIPGSGGATPFIDVQSGNLSISSGLGGTGGFVKSGAGTLALSGLNSYTGNTTVTGGSLVLAAPGQLADGGTLALSGGGAIFLNAGSETVAALVSDGGTIAGGGVLQAATYQLGNGTTVSGQLGTGVLSTEGTVLMSGSSAAATVNVGAGTLTLTGSNLSDLAALTLSAGATIDLLGGDGVASLVSNGGTIAGPGVLGAASYSLNDGTSVSGHLGDGAIVTNGAVGISGSTGNGSLTVASGILSLGGTSLATDVQVQGGVLSLTGDNLSDLATVTVMGGLAVGGAETIATLVVDGGSVSGSGLLGASLYQLGDGSSVSGHLGGGELVSSGVVSISGSALADTIRIGSGSLANTGILGGTGTWIDIAAGARLVADGVQNYQLLTTSGSGAGIWEGNLANGGTIRPGDLGTTGVLGVSGDFANSPGGTLALDVGISGSDLLVVGGSASFAGTLEIARLGAGEIAAFVPVQVIQASSYSGNFDSLLEDLDGAVLFNPLDGTITRLGGGAGGGFPGGVTTNQASTWAALYDDVIDPGRNNVTHHPGGTPPFSVTSGIASADEPGLLWALSASITPAGLDAALLNRLSPEVYAGLGDYSAQATRTHRHSAMHAPGLPAPAAAPASNGSKDAKSALSSPPPPAWEVFAAADYFDGETDGSLNGANHGLSGAGVVAGLRISPWNRVRVAAYLAGDDGELSGGLIDADARGISAGLTGEWIIGETGALRLTGGLAYGAHRFEGTRGSASATAAGWSPGFAAFSDVDAEAFDVFLGLDSVAWKNDRFRVIPGLGLEFRSSSTDAFREYGPDSAAGGPLTLAVDASNRDSLVGVLSLAAEADVSRHLTLDVRGGLNVDLKGDDPERISARFTDGERSMAALAEPLSEELFYLGVGATWSASGDLRVRLGYRAEFREDAHPLGEFSLGATFRF